MSENLEHPTLYQASGPGPVLLGGQCARCGLNLFPRQSFGCEGCGAAGDELKAATLAARGVLVSYAKVHRHFGKDIATPFTIGEIRLEAGPLIRCTLADDAGDLHIGQIMIGVLAHNPASDADVRELRFAAEAR